MTASATQTPITAYQPTRGMLYFARMLDKLRKHARGELRADFQENLGIGFDGRCLDYLRINYNDLKIRVAEGGTDEEILAWCFNKGRTLNEQDIVVWNGFISKVGWNDPFIPNLVRRKKEAGLEGRDDILTMIDYFEVDEGRKP